MNPVAIRLLSQQLICQQFATPAQVVDYMGAIQAQEYRLMRWAVGMRTLRPSLSAFKKAFDGGQIIRLHLMRGTWQLVSAVDYYPLLRLCAPKALSVIKGWMSSNKISIPDHEVAKIRPILVSAAERLGSVTKEDFVQALSEKDIHMDDHRLSYHIRLSELDGVLCSGDLLPMKASYALSERKIPSSTGLSREEALLLLTRKYFRSRQPATLEDFVWWSGLNINDCRRGIQMAGDYLHTEKRDGRSYYLTDDVRTRGFRKGRYLLIPPYDEYLIAYKSRDVVLPPDFSHKAHNNMGTFQPVIAADGLICGNWSPFCGAHQARFFTGEHDTDLQDEWTRYLGFLSK
ncbi:MAG: AlkZ family DNA glycosylase [Bacteroidales bacterium]|nr:AlkZ family DNA glycosylase [Bacteroidales bacterium]